MIISEFLCSSLTPGSKNFFISLTMNSDNAGWVSKFVLSHTFVSTDMIVQIDCRYVQLALQIVIVFVINMILDCHVWVRPSVTMANFQLKLMVINEINQYTNFWQWLCMESSPCSSDIHLLPKNKLALLRMPFAVILLGKDVVYTLVIIFLAKLQPWIFIHKCKSMLQLMRNWQQLSFLGTRVYNS